MQAELKSQKRIATGTWSRCHGQMAGMWQLEAVFLARDLKSSDLAGLHTSHVVQRVFSHQKWDEKKLMKLIQELRSMYVECR